MAPLCCRIESRLPIGATLKSSGEFVLRIVRQYRPSSCQNIYRWKTPSSISYTAELMSRARYSWHIAACRHIYKYTVCFIQQWGSTELNDEYETLDRIHTDLIICASGTSSFVLLNRIPGNSRMLILTIPSKSIELECEIGRYQLTRNCNIFLPRFSIVTRTYREYYL